MRLFNLSKQRMRMGMGIWKTMRMFSVCGYPTHLHIGIYSRYNNVCTAGNTVLLTLACRYMFGDAISSRQVCFCFPATLLNYPECFHSLLIITLVTAYQWRSVITWQLILSWLQVVINSQDVPRTACLLWSASFCGVERRLFVVRSMWYSWFMLCWSC